MTSPASTRARRLLESLGLLETRRFGTFWFATLLSNLGFWAQQVAEPWLLLDLHASAVMIGLDAFMLDAPQWAFTVVGGVLADRADRRRVIAGFQTIQMLCPLALVVLLLTGAIAPWMVVALAFVVGVTDALSMPSYRSIVPSIHSATAMNGMYDATFTAKHATSPVPASSAPARAGPRIRDRLNWIELRARPAEM